jgi:MFS transporter, MHS family, proline/betaine transporter
MNKRKLVISSSLANIFEWYDYALYGHFAQLIGDKFFSGGDPAISLLEAFLVFAVGYLMRPLGGIFFGVLGDKYGRKAALSSAIICMAFPTAMIGLLPTYNDVGSIATTLMIVVRVLQGLSMGGALTGSISFIIEHTDPKQRGLVGSLPMACICIGLLLGSFVSYLVRISLSPEQFDSFGWRIPFLLGIFIFFVGSYIRKSTEETPLFEELRSAGNISKTPLRSVITDHWFDMLMTVFINSTGSVIFYLEAIYLAIFLKNGRGFDVSSVDYLNSLGYIIMAVVAVIIGWLSDIVERRRLFMIFNIMILIIFNCGFMNFFDTGNFMITALAQIALAIFAGAYIGPEPALQAEFYPTNIRNTALSLSYNVSVSLFGGTAPYVITLLVTKTGSLSTVSYYITSCAVCSLIGLYFYKNRAQL